MLVNILLFALGIIILMFVFWHKLKDDYSSEIIFSSCVFIIAGILFGILISLLARPYWFWLILAFALSGFGLAVIRYKLIFYEAFEAFIVAVLPITSLVFLNESIRLSNVPAFLVFFGLICGLVFYYFFDTHYKNFSWYKSGRVGLSGLLVAGILLTLRAIFVTSAVGVLSFIGQPDIFISASSAFLLFLLAYRLARRYD